MIVVESVSEREHRYGDDLIFWMIYFIVRLYYSFKLNASSIHLLCYSFKFCIFYRSNLKNVYNFIHEHHHCKCKL